jgi:anti-sigma B factor antagonist
MPGSPLEDTAPGSEDPLEAREKEVMAAVSDSGDAPLNVKVIEREGLPVVQLEGELDLYTAAEFRNRLGEVLEAGPPAVVIDLSRTSYIDSSGLAVLLRASKVVSGTLAVVSPRDRVTRLFQVTGLASSLTLHRTLAEALKALSPPSGG